MNCPRCGTFTNFRAVNEKHELVVIDLAPEYATTLTIGGKNFDVYKRVRECSECGDQFAAFEIMDDVLDRIIGHLTNNSAESDAQVENFKASVIAEITKMKLPKKK